ncbi:ORF6C domain-containing protein [Clostridium sp. UBA3887]|uniref:ORF6C domain-containing protein n=1 Tax=Clostridium sp. UBA3887 TaxID=1946356 RepID=UPI00321620F4
MNKLIVKGIKQIETMKFHDIEGGFGEGKKSMLVKEIAKIHSREFKHINEAINKNETRFKKNVDIIDLKSVDLIDRDFLNQLGFSNSSISNANNIYLLSERGYAKLLKILEDDVAWEQYEKLVDGYFNMRTSQPKLSKELQAIFTLDERTIEIDNRVSKLENTMTIDYAQQEELNSLAKRVVVQALGGKDAPAYRELNKKAFSQIWNDYKRVLQVNSYKNTPVKDLEFARKVIIDWKPSRELELMVKGCNAQIRI